MNRSDKHFHTPALCKVGRNWTLARVSRSANRLVLIFLKEGFQIRNGKFEVAHIFFLTVILPAIAYLEPLLPGKRHLFPQLERNTPQIFVIFLSRLLKQLIKLVVIEPSLGY